ncbi:hypothetical protein H6F50_13520 [Coleofasciculus sp. FACHB-712]|nr:hypothetical protein [Coleofasciculus sp. FACHB-712]MBD1943358.1 hypothetical protein [Coleofasciculus sp. FACHB-712]
MRSKGIKELDKKLEECDRALYWVECDRAAVGRGKSAIALAVTGRG